MNCLDYSAEIFWIFYSQWDYQMLKISRILKLLTWHGFDEFGWIDPTFPPTPASCSLILNLFHLPCYSRSPKLNFIDNCTRYGSSPVAPLYVLISILLKPAVLDWILLQSYTRFREWNGWINYCWDLYTIIFTLNRLFWWQRMWLILEIIQAFLLRSVFELKLESLDWIELNLELKLGLWDWAWASAWN